MKNNKALTYTYRFADGTTCTISFGSEEGQIRQRKWGSELMMLDRMEHNNQRAESRRHTSLEAQDPMNKGGYYEDHSMENAQLAIELEDALKSLSADLKRIARLLDDGCSASDIARLDKVNRSSISRKIGKIRKVLKKSGF